MPIWIRNPEFQILIVFSAKNKIKFKIFRNFKIFCPFLFAINISKDLMFYTM